ncbi:MAG: mannose-1-phosphate guanylyltransferase/mannose-6-phosphate isomerase [Gammaproteobacteria bacterium CG_4_10_14_0_8_um_filter_38_16]|nr:MAG: mannose-1-phosphate guanylyltransferase/mannose-6-phosphate isomerase [Gammaproteobacteria bacterium CG_4_10_14_0_8_um_filter_38_16]PJA03963.1 MAG: mannose-1-phosphate guanylyltransferase/mannose-6-phosphate isomerase [Gammaproteobacteria bacterium CG_4_10_14_0_2_um_filter_38_22]PJB10843.1 MAG: mannose-1-phosphate guanylyltransferase/mannose-6-phosphate isomerase [Gammaproteobacteria bacterium CG_4_9_14_3_um_filter_38_9]
MSNTLFPVVLAGGSGSRLWPLSRQAYPKQLLSLLDNHSLLQNTLLRVNFKPVDVAKPIVITNAAFRFLVAEQLRDIQVDADIILESVGRNTAPAVAIAAMRALQFHPDPILLVMPADHVITKQVEWERAIKAACFLVEKNYLVTLGICPDSPVTGYGYIKPGKNVADGFLVDQFIEKPNSMNAETYVKNNYLWNSGIFVFSAKQYLAELMQFNPDIIDCCEAALKSGCADLDFLRLDAQALQRCPSDSVDYAVMEKTKQAAVIPVSMGWSDIGSWSALHELSEKDSNGNCVIGDVVQLDTSNSYLRSEKRMIAALGLKDCIVIETADAILAAHKDYAQNIKAVVNQLKLSNRSEAETGRKVFRPWGWYESIAQSTGFQVKEICVNSGAKLSLQRHQHRSENWVVVSGEALVHCDGREFILKSGESTFIPAKTKHRLSNLSEVPLHIIEVQCGEYLGEDDIERFEDVFGRVGVAI